MYPTICVFPRRRTRNQVKVHARARTVWQWYPTRLPRRSNSTIFKATRWPITRRQRSELGTTSLVHKDWDLPRGLTTTLPTCSLPSEPIETYTQGARILSEILPLSASSDNAKIDPLKKSSNKETNPISCIFLRL